MDLAEFLSGISAKKIEKSYEKYCESTCPIVQSDQTLEEDEMEDHQEVQNDEEDANECEKLLTTVQQETLFADPDESAQPELPEPVDMHMRNVSDKEQMESLLSDVPQDKDQQPVRQGDKEFMPSTLMEAMSLPGCRWNALFRLAVKLRNAPGGMDTQWIADARHVRRASSRLNWFQCLGLAILFFRSC